MEMNRKKSVTNGNGTGNYEGTQEKGNNLLVLKRLKSKQSQREGYLYIPNNRKGRRVDTFTSNQIDMNSPKSLSYVSRGRQ